MASSGLGSVSNSASSQGGGTLRQEASALARQVNRLLNRQLSSVCQVNGVKSTGIKADLQGRIHNLIQEAVNANDPVRLQQIRQSVHNSISNSYTVTPNPRPALAHSHSHAPSAPFGLSSMSFPNTHNSLSNGQRFGGSQAVTLNFKSSPFYQIEAHVGEVKVCDVMSQHRNTVTYPIRLEDHPYLQKCVDDPSYRVMIFCAGECLGTQEVAFPHQSELKVNGGEIKANLRGLKNKPGSTRPVDITKALRLRPKYTNNVDFTYALTSKAGPGQKFYLVVNICKITSVEELASRIANGKRISIESVKQELNAKAQDPDVVATSQVLSLKSVDGYVKDILAKTSKSQETVTIEPNGDWHTKSSEDSSQGQTNGNSSHQGTYDDDDDDDLVISEVNPIGHRRMETPKNGTPSVNTPGTAGRDSSSAGPRGVASTSAKRPVAAIIDLTLSDDDDEPAPPPKRQNTSTNGFLGSNGLSGSSPVSPDGLGYL
ncbi:putative relatd to e3like factor in the sumo pathway [Fusarium sporotrichioides]|uniref:Putative relatd to e3like factor in the sumo pathway n=1 Tax=Fusarium sporotrichioides TaxID=5514 RepID=A0A395RKM2_FUSSP|nr:putative relatd to e3like factor in the sumo pathway [Fusarium sporotrichioides]